MSDLGPMSSGVRVGGVQRAGWLARIATVNRLPDPTKCLIVSAAVVPFLVAWVLRLTALQTDPHLSSYISREFLPTMVWVLEAELAGHALIMACALFFRARGRERVTWLVHAQIQGLMASFAFMTHAIGLFTSPVIAVLLVWPIVGNTVFTPRLMRFGFVTLSLAIALIIALERMGVIPYAPLLEQPPVGGGRLVTSWILFIGLPAVGAAAVVVLAHGWIVTQWLRRELELETLIGIDFLTGVANRRTFFDRLEAELARSQRHDKPLSVLMVDVDHFKGVNDRHGHQVGDVVLSLIAKELCDALRAADVVARYGGEEFSIILPETDQEEAARAGERVRAAIAADSLLVGPTAVDVTVSVGVASMLPGEAADQLVFRADAALLEAKRSGRDRLVVAAAAPRLPALQAT